MIFPEIPIMNSDEIKAEYTSSLADLKFNSRPLINVLTILAEENVANAPVIVAAIEEHLAKVPTEVKLPILYLIDCITKNIGDTYKILFSQNICTTFCNVFKVVDEKTRAEMFKLRQTWNDVFPQKKLYAIDVQISLLDPAWPVTAAPPSNSIHVNPKFFNNSTNKQKPAPPSVVPVDNATITMQQKLIQKQKELIELQQKKLELELLQTQVKWQKEKEAKNLLLKPEVARQMAPEQQTKQKLMNVALSKSSGPKISPANSALITASASVRPLQIRDPRLLRAQQAAEKVLQQQAQLTSINSSSTPTILDSSNKIVTTNSKSVRDNRIEPHLLNNKDNILSTTQSQTKSSNNMLKTYQKPASSSTNTTNFSRLNSTIKSNRNNNSSSKNDDFKAGSSSSSLKSSSSSSLVDSPKKSDKTSPKWSSKSSSRHDKKKSSKHGGSDKKSFKDSKRDRNQKDVDLRITAPPEKLPRLLGDALEDRKGAMDVDLRQLGTKKRSSTENADSGSSKKSKNQVFDVLFGNEDVDLRTVLPTSQLPERPPTPPPPIISLLDVEVKKPILSNLDAIRAKLANATGRDKIMSKSFNRKRLPQDEDLRPKPILPSAADSMKKIIISPDDEQCIKAGTMTREQEKQLMNKIIAQIEHQKLQEAQEKDKADSEQSQARSDEDTGDNSRDFPKSSRPGIGENRRGYWGGRGSGGGPKRRHWEPPSAARPRPWMNNPNPWRPPFANRINEVIEIGGKKSPDVTVINDLVVDSVNQDDIKTIDIDGIPRDIRYYDETAIVFMNWDDPREISFQNGTRYVVFDEIDRYMLAFNDEYKEVKIGGEMHQVRLGAPSREIYIDARPYECYFGGPAIKIDLSGRTCSVQMEGPAPQVKIGTLKRDDLVAGKLNLIIDAKILVPVFLDAKIQKFVIDGETHRLKFVDALKTVLINDVPFKVEFGGLPKPITVHDTKHFIRFSVLPSGVKPGQVSIKDMDGCTNAVVQPRTLVEPERNSNSPHFFQNIMQQSNLDLLSNVLNTSTSQPTSPGGGYAIEPPLLPPTSQQPNEAATPQVPLLPSTLNINDLFQKLVATGIVASNKEPTIPPPVEKPPRSRSPKQHSHSVGPSIEQLRPITFSRTTTLKHRQSLLYDVLYNGMQCSSCGMRFPPEQSVHYSQHLDWHFRQNRKGKKNIRVASSRRWYYSLSDWKNYEEIEDLEEREKNFFDQQQQQDVGGENEEEVEIPSVPADPDVQNTYCNVCEDKFDLFFNEDKEEWHLRNAIRIDDKTYHPVCYDDYLQSLNQPKVEEEPVKEEVASEEPTPTIIPGLEIILDDDEEEEELNNKEEIKVDEVVDESSQNSGGDVVIEESDDSKPENEENGGDWEDDDDDVILHEVEMEKIEIDDDREYIDTIPADIPVKIEQIDDGFMDVEEGLINMKNGVAAVKIKSEPIDHDEVVIDGENMAEDAPFAVIDEESLPAQSVLMSSMDGNTDHLQNVIPAPLNANLTGNRIKINISKPMPVVQSTKEVKDGVDDAVTIDSVIDPSQPLPPGEEPPIQLNVKPALRGVELKKMPLVQKGSELTGMCSIM